MAVHAGVALVVVAGVALLGEGTRWYKVPIRGWICLRVIYRIYAVITPVSIVTFIYHASQVRGAFANCDLLPFNVVSTTMSFLFFVRLLLETLDRGRAPPLATLVESWLLVNACRECSLGVAIYSYQFLSLLRLCYVKTRDFYISVLSVRLCYSARRAVQAGIGAVLVMTTLAGVLQTTEEWQDMILTDPGEAQPLTLLHTYLEYMYMAFITMTSIGYGDMVPTTTAARVAVMVASVVAIVWFLDTLKDMYDACCEVGDVYSNAIPDRWKEDKVVVVCCGPGRCLPEFLDVFHSSVSSHASPVVLLHDDMDQQVVSDLREKQHYLRPRAYFISARLNDVTLDQCYAGLKGHLRGHFIILNDPETADIEAADAQAFNTVVLVKTFTSQAMVRVKVTVQVLKEQTKMAIEVLAGWQEDDRVVCLERTTAGLMATSLVTSGAASLLTSIVSPHAQKLGNITRLNQLREPPSNALLAQADLRYLQGLAAPLTIHPGDKFKATKSFVSAATHHYLSDGSVLLGYCGFEEVVLLTTVPIEADRVLIPPLRQRRAPASRTPRGERLRSSFNF